VGCCFRSQRNLLATVLTISFISICEMREAGESCFLPKRTTPRRVGGSPVPNLGTNMNCCVEDASGDITFDHVTVTVTDVLISLDVSGLLIVLRTVQIGEDVQ
jgi:hypothetical protein